MDSIKAAKSFFRMRLLGCLLFAVMVCLSACGGGGYDMTVTIDPAEGAKIPADGITAAKIMVKMKKDGDLLNTGAVQFSTSMGLLNEPNLTGEMVEGGSQQLSVSLNMGVANAQLTSVQPGTARVRVEFTDEETGVVEASVEMDVIFQYALAPETAKVATIEFVSADPETIKIFNTSAEGQTSTKLTFQVLDKMNLPVANKAVYFSIPKPLGNSTLVPRSTKTDVNGYAVTYLTSGKVAGVAEVVAGTELYENRTDDYISGTGKVLVVAGSANYNNFSVACEQTTIAGFGSTGISQYDGVTMKCHAYVADRDSQVIPNQPVLFAAEAGSVTPLVYTSTEGVATSTYMTQDPKPFPTLQGTGKDASSVSFVYLTSGSSIYQALSSADSSFGANGAEVYIDNWMAAYDALVYDANYKTWYEKNNPRDGLATLIAVTGGAELLTKDLNSNGICDNGDSFLSMGEPFIDRDDSGDYNDGEYFLDINNDGVRNGPANDSANLPYKISTDCSLWKENTQIWKQTKILWHGNNEDRFTGFLVVAKSTGATAETGRLLGKYDEISMPQGGAVSLDVYALDERLNSVYNDTDDATLKCSSDGNASISVSPEDPSMVPAFGPAPLATITVSATPEPGDEYMKGTNRVTCTANLDIGDVDISINATAN